jgi:endonuclease YncB( thermonuclease family)
MFGWRKKPDGFEWHQYIRTTVKVRRENRRRRIDDAKRAAVEQIGAAGSALAAGSKAAGAAARDQARAGLGVAGTAARSAGFTLLASGWALLERLGVALSAVLRRLAVALQPATKVLEKTNVGAPVAIAGAVALGSGIGRVRSAGMDGETWIALGIGLVLLLAVLPMLSRVTGIGTPRFGMLGLSPRAAVGAAAVVVVAGIAWFVGRGGAELASLGGHLPFGGGKAIEGRAQALTGDLLRVGGTVVRLAGIEAPEPEQRCGKSGRQWRCGISAQAALSRLVGGRTVHCTREGSDGAGRTVATCMVAKTDVAAELVERGHVFSEEGFFARYSSEEQEARTAKAGLWSGEAERPSEYRAKAWDEAKLRAPDGCPIKGLVRDGDRIYVLPGAPEYERGKVQKSRGERWFCSEQEAVSAGFKAAERG